MSLPERPSAEGGRFVRLFPRRRRYRAAALIALLAVLAGAVFMARRMLRRQADPIEVAVVMPLTGPQGHEGHMMVNAVKLYFNSVNKRGGIGGHPLRVIEFDDEGKPEVAVRRAKEIA